MISYVSKGVKSALDSLICVFGGQACNAAIYPGFSGRRLQVTSYRSQAYRLQATVIGNGIFLILLLLSDLLAQALPFALVPCFLLPWNSRQKQLSQCA
jgi:hypothetical protein